MKLDPRFLTLLRQRRLQVLLVVTLALLAALCIVGQARALSLAIDGAFLHGQPWTEVRRWVGWFLLLATGRALLQFGSDWLAGEVALAVKSELRERLLAHIAQLGPAYTAGARSGELATTVGEGIEQLDAYFRQYLPQVALAALIPLAYLAIVLPLDPLSGLVLLFTAPLIPLFMVLIGSTADKLTNRQWRVLGKLSAYFLDVLQGLSTLKRLGQSRGQAARLAELATAHRQATMGVLRVAFLSALTLELLSTLSVAIIAVEIGLRLLYGRMVFADALFLLVLAPDFYLPLRQLGVRFHAGMQGVAAGQRIFQILEREGVDEDVPTPALVAPPALPADICFAGVSVQYAGRELPALHAVDFCWQAGEVLAVMGPSGSGKSTLGQCLLRFVAPTAGEITVGGAPLAAIDVKKWRRQIAWVPQQPFLLPASIMDNIRLARPEASTAEVQQAARSAFAHEFIMALPDGYDTVLGEQGARLSGGQAQRIALARAFLKDAPLLVLDEATAHLDPASVEMIAEALAELLVGRSALVIAHRPATVRLAHRILVLQEGQVLQVGDHASLLAEDGLYRRLWLAAGGRA